jgi:hypothetical protein
MTALAGELREIAGRARRLAKDATHVRLMFGNGAHALDAAQRARAMLRGPTA